jgi:hypothetical protein
MTLTTVTNIAVYRSAADYPNRPMAMGTTGTHEADVLACRLTRAAVNGAYPVKSQGHDGERYVVAFTGSGQPWVWMARCTFVPDDPASNPFKFDKA